MNKKLEDIKLDDIMAGVKELPYNALLQLNCWIVEDIFRLGGDKKQIKELKKASPRMKLYINLITYSCLIKDHMILKLNEELIKERQ